jgi:SAM-dependent methyltransferase
MDKTFLYRDKRYPTYLRTGNAMQFIMHTARQFCVGTGLDVGAGRWPLPGAIPIDIKNGEDAMALPLGHYDFIFSSHCLEHLPNPVAALEHWQSRLRYRGTLFLYLPHWEMEYWRPENCRKHLHSFEPAKMAALLGELGFDDIMYGERDLAWSFSVVGFNRLKDGGR